MLAGASVRQLFFWSPVVGKSCLLAVSLPHSSCDGERKPGCLIDSRDGQSFVTRQGTLGERRWRLLVSADTMGQFHSTSECWFSVLDQLVSGLLSRVTGGIQKTGRLAAWARDFIKRQDEPGAGVYVCPSKSLFLLSCLFSSHPFIHWLSRCAASEMRVNLLKKMEKNCLICWRRSYFLF